MNDDQEMMMVSSEDDGKDFFVDSVQAVEDSQEVHS